MRIHSLHPGVTADEVRDNTGFEVVVPENVAITPTPTSAQIALLRKRIDPAGELRIG
jgi:hypothetical protein